MFFFKLEADDFEVKGDPKEIAQWEWRKFEGEGEPWGEGWAEGHLAFMRLLKEHEKAENKG